MNPTPLPTPVPTDVVVDPNRVTPGLLGFLAFAFLILAVVVLYFSLRKQLSRVDFDEGAAPGGVRPLPKYATKEERRKSALRLQKEREAAAASAGGTTVDPLAPTDGAPASDAESGQGTSAEVGDGPSTGTSAEVGDGPSTGTSDAATSEAGPSTGTGDATGARRDDEHS